MENRSIGEIIREGLEKAILKKGIIPGTARRAFFDAMD